MLRFLSFILIAIAVACSVPVGMALFGSNRLSVPTAIGLHAACAVFAAVGFYLQSPRTGPRRRRGNIGWLSAAVGSAVAPFYGIWSVIIVAVVYRRMDRHLTAIDDGEITVPGEEVFSTPLIKSKQLEILERLDIEPFTDIFRRGESAFKKSAIHFLSAVPSRESVDMLNMALMDDDIEVRLYAAGVIGVMDDYYQKEIDRCRARCEANPGSAELAIDLADIYRSYAESGLADETTSGSSHREAIRVLSTLPMDADMRYRLASSLFALGRYEEAKEQIDSCVEKNQSVASYRLLRSRVLFALRQYDSVAEEVKRMRSQNLLPADDPLAQYWG